MKKTFTYAGRRFQLTVTLSTMTLVVSHLGAANYQKSYPLTEAGLEREVEQAMREARHWADTRDSLTPVQQHLLSLGFTQ